MSSESKDTFTMLIWEYLGEGPCQFYLIPDAFLAVRPAIERLLVGAAGHYCGSTDEGTASSLVYLLSKENYDHAYEYEYVKKRFPEWNPEWAGLLEPMRVDAKRIVVGPLDDPGLFRIDGTVTRVIASGCVL